MRPKGYKHSEETRRKISETKKKNPCFGKFANENHPRWKGDDVSYDGLHYWIRKHFPKPEDGLCMLCHQTPLRQAANLTGILNREFKNWAWFCIPCHKKYDNIIPRLTINRKHKTKRNDSQL